MGPAQGVLMGLSRAVEAIVIGDRHEDLQCPVSLNLVESLGIWRVSSVCLYETGWRLPVSPR